jgi:hypothetical protein
MPAKEVPSSKTKAPYESSSSHSMEPARANLCRHWAERILLLSPPATVHRRGRA